MENSPCRRISLLGCAHPVAGKHFQVLEVYLEVDRIEVLLGRRPYLALLVVFFFCKIIGKNPVSVYVMSQSCNKTPFCMIYTI